MARFVLDTDKDFTPGALVDHLNNTLGTKKGGKKFTFSDVQQYIRRGFLPKAYGGNPLSWRESEEIGVRVIRVDPLNQKTEEE